LQYVVLEKIHLDESTLNNSVTFCKPRGPSGRVSADKFIPYLIVPGSMNDNGAYDIRNNPIAPDELFEIQIASVLKYFVGKWIPLPYSSILQKKSLLEIESNDWVRLYIGGPSQSDYGITLDLVLCVDTECAGPEASKEYARLDLKHLNKPVVLDTKSAAFWNSSALKTWIERVGTGIPSSNPLDVYPDYSHFYTLLKVLSDILPAIEICEEIGSPIDVHLILDVGNSRTCGILVESRPGTELKPDTAFEKLQIRNLSHPTMISEGLFETRCMFMPSPFDSLYYASNWTPNFRTPSLLRIGDAAKTETSRPSSSGFSFGRSTLTSPKRYLWSEAPNPSPWYFGMNPIDGGVPVIKGDILSEIAEDGRPKWLTKAPMSFEPCYPHSSMMTFFILEVLTQAFGFINSWEYRQKKPDTLCKRMLKSIILTAPNGMVTSERNLYRDRVAHAVNLFWKFYHLPEKSKPEVFLGYDEATCVQLVYIYSLIKDKLRGESDTLFKTLGRKRVTPQGQIDSLRVAAIDIGGGTSDLMITEFRDASSGAVTNLIGKSLFQEGVSVAGDDVVRNLIREVLMPCFIKWADSWYGNGEITMEHLETFFGAPNYRGDPRFIGMKRLLLDTFWIPLAYKYLEHAQYGNGPGVVQHEYINLEIYPRPEEPVKDFFKDTLSEIIGRERGIFPILDETVWEMNRQAINDTVYNTLYQTLRIFSEVIVQYNCDVIVIGGKMSSLPEVRDILINFCPVAPHRIVSMTNFDAGKWYPFDLQRYRIKDAKTTVAVGAALWFFAEKLRCLPMFGLKTDRELIDKGTIFVGQVINRQIKDRDMLFPKGSRNLSLVGTTYLGARRIDSEHSHANMLYEINFGGTENYATPVSVILRQDGKDKSHLSLVQAVDARGKSLTNLKISLRTLENDLHWIDEGSAW
jgi:hypothetical protein